MAPETKAWIDQAGGYRTVAARLGENATTVHNWTRSPQFPLAQYHALRALGDDLGIGHPPDGLFPFKAYPPSCVDEAGTA